MSDNSKKFEDSGEFRTATYALIEYQRRHNLIRKDYELLLEITELHLDDSDKFDTLYRASLKGFLSLIESDIYGLNQIDQYDGYSDKHSFEDRFKKTFKKICHTWKKDEVIIEFIDNKYSKLKLLKIKRDRLIHPKKITDVVCASVDEFNELREVFHDYTKMHHSIMNGFFISFEIKCFNDICKLFKE